MTETTYIRSIDSHPDGQDLTSTLPAVSSPSAPPTSVSYDDVTYTTTSPFSYTSCDPSLLTPISSVGSPSMQQQSKLSRGYSPTGGSQQPTPPASSKIGWATGGSPMTVHPASVSENHFNISYVTADPKNHLPEDPNPYYGNFTVSADSIKSETPERSMSSYYHPLPPGVPSPYPMIHGSLPAMPTDPMMPAHLPSAYDPPGSQIGPASGIYPSQRHYSPPRDVFIDRVSKSKPRSQRRQKRQSEVGDLAGLGDRDLPGALEQVNLDPSTSPEWRCVIEEWLQTGHLKGKNQWQEIQARHEKAGFGKKQPQALQMMLTRAKAKCVIWSPRMNDLLRELYMKDQEDKYNRIAAMFNDARGRGALHFNAANIEAKLVELGLEDIYMDPETKIRPRKRLGTTGKKRSRANAAEAEAQMNDIQPLHLTDEEHEELMEQIGMARGSQQMLHHDSADDDDDDANTGIYGGGGGPEGLAGSAAEKGLQSERVARQACQEMIKTQLLGDH